MGSTLDNELKEKLMPKDNITPHIYGLPKVHKKEISLQPIVNTIRSPSYRLAKFLVGKLNPLVGRTCSYVKDLAYWINEIKNDKLDEYKILVSFDVVSLYTKIPIAEAIEIIENKWIMT